MSSIVTIDLRHVARGLDVPLRQIQAVVELLDEGNTVPFITRYRKDRTGGLDEEQIREIQSRLAKMRLLADRKQTILRSIEAQGKLTEKLAKQIHSAMSTKRLEDLYLPYKPKKQTLATLARTRGLEELAHEILDAAESCTDLDSRARDFANTDRQVPSAAEALLGAGHILAEHFSERADLRQRLREILQRTGKIISTQIGGEPAPPVAAHGATVRPEAPPAVSGGATVEAQPAEGGDAAGGANSPAVHPHPDHLPEGEGDANANPPAVHPHPDPLPLVLQRQAGEGDMNADPPQDHRVPLALPVPPTVVAEPAAVSPPARPAPAKRIKENVKAAKLNKKELKKKRIEQRRIKAFRDYFNYCEEIKKIPPHRILAINRAERARVLRVRIECDLEAMHEALDEMLVPPGHPHADYLRGCARDALQRLILPALERDIRRELTDRAEAHAVGVFAKNLRNLLLQPPVHNRRVLAVDPGYKSGCKLAALDQFGNILAHDVIWLVGKPERRDEAKQKVIELVTRCELSVVAVGNGTASRETEDFFAELISNELQGRGVAYLVVNEAGASVYSTSQTGREEFPHYDATLRGAISIGRRLQDPLSELVKIDPANIGVGLYQHDVKAKHLRVSLDDVVESCVNYVGVDVNTASPALLRYVSGLNQLTARRVYEHRREHGPFRNRQQLHEVPGLGEATFVQAAGFLKITGGNNPLDATWIHPESYAAAARLLEQLGCGPADLVDKEATAALSERTAGIDLDAKAKDLDVGALTLKDILSQLARPGRDPREDLPPPIFRQGVLKLEDLTAGMELSGTVLNVVDFGCFVDIGMHDSGLVHVSRLADRFIRDPHEVVAVGDVVKVWVMEVDKERRRVSLTMVRPGSERSRRPRQEEKAAEKPADGPRPEASERRPPRKPGPPPSRPPEARRGRPQGPPSGRPRVADRPSSRPPARPPQPKPRPKPLIPITDAMKTGKEPMRTFGDLMQFFEVKQEDPVAKPAQQPEPMPALPEPEPPVEAPPPEPEPPVEAPAPVEPKEP